MDKMNRVFKQIFLIFSAVILVLLAIRVITDIIAFETIAAFLIPTLGTLVLVRAVLQLRFPQFWSAHPNPAYRQNKVLQLIAAIILQISLACYAAFLITEKAIFVYISVIAFPYFVIDSFAGVIIYIIRRIKATRNKNDIEEAN